MQITFNPHVKEDVDIINKIIGAKGTILNGKTKRAKNRVTPATEQSCDEALALIRDGIQRPVQIRKRLKMTTGQIGAVLRRLIRLGRVRATGSTSSRLYHLK